MKSYFYKKPLSGVQISWAVKRNMHSLSLGPNMTQSLSPITVAWVHIRRKVFAKYFALNQRFQKHQKFLRRKNKSLTNIFTRIIPRVFTQIFIRIVIQNCFDGTGSIERIVCVASNVIMTIPWVSPVTIFSTFTKCL